jgi:hypothetical protein
MQEILVLPHGGIQGRYLRYGDGLIARRSQSHIVTSTELAFLEDSEVEPGAAAPQEALYHIPPLKTGIQLEAGHPRLGDHQLSGPDPENVADPHHRL